MIRKAKLSEIEEIITITRACGAKMASEGIFQWYEFYPNKEAFQKDVLRDELYVLISEDSIIGCIVISSEKDAEYNNVDWLTKDGQNYYIHRLAIHPSHQKKGHAKRLMDFAESLAREKNIASVRLDTFSENQRNNKFYEARGYTRLGSIFFPKQSEHPFYCYEIVF
jgi:ribosomal protein S18 acetylase RimI-like enzyme